ncbi:hypothetical protein TKK_0007372 [Trichogramma kaykai]
MFKFFFASVALLLLAIANRDCAVQAESAHKDDNNNGGGGGVSVRPTQQWRFLDGSERRVLPKYREEIHEFGVGRIKCLRYCIQSKDSMAPHVLHLLWQLQRNKSQEMGSETFVNDVTSMAEIPQLDEKRFVKEDESRDRSSDHCTFSVVIGCEIPKEIQTSLRRDEKDFIKSLLPNPETLEGGRGTNHFVSQPLTQRDNLFGEQDIEFQVPEEQAEVSMVVLGKISKIDIKMPIAETTTSSSVAAEATTTTTTTAAAKDASSTAAAAAATSPRLILATARMPGGVQGLRLNVINPPPGGWRLKLDAADGQVYRLSVQSSVVPEFAHPESIARNNGSVVEEKDAMMASASNQITERRLPDAYFVEGQAGDQLLANHRVEVDNVVVAPNNRTSDMIQERSGWVGDEDVVQDRLDEGRNGAYLLTDTLVHTRNEELPVRKPILVELDEQTSLIVSPGRIHSIWFKVTNNYLLPLTPQLAPAVNSPFLLVGMSTNKGLAPFIHLLPGETGRVRLEIDVPIHAAESMSGIVTLQVNSVVITEKSAQVFVMLEGKSNYDVYKPLVYYNFNNNCAGRTTGDRCLKSFWSVDVTIQDLNSGLKSVESVPKGIYPRTPYVSGTRGPVHFYYTSNCCNRAFELSAVDTTGNKVIRIIDVNAWYNLTEGEVAAICLGVVLILVLAALAVVTGLYCAHKRKSHNFSADYGYRASSRQQPPSASPPRE